MQRRLTPGKCRNWPDNKVLGVIPKTAVTACASSWRRAEEVSPLIVALLAMARKFSPDRLLSAGEGEWCDIETQGFLPFGGLICRVP